MTRELGTPSRPGGGSEIWCEQGQLCLISCKVKCLLVASLAHKKSTAQTLFNVFLVVVVYCTLSLCLTEEMRRLKSLMSCFCLATAATP